MMMKSNVAKFLLAGCAVAALSACGADDVASPGSGGDITITNPEPTTPTTPGGGDGSVTAAAGCPSIEVALTDSGTITGPTGTWRVCTLPAKISEDTTLPKIAGLLYEMSGRVDVGDDLGATPASGEKGVTLTIQPGVILYGKAASWLAVNRGNKIYAVGAADKPIIFTSQQNITGSNSDSSSGQWGGVVLLGRAQITDCLASASTGTAGTIGCARTTEGAADLALYGGETNDDSSGEMKYVQIRYSGYVLSGDSELQGLTPSGIGSKTKLEYIQIHNSSDDGVEFFGGHPQIKHLIVTGAEDDSLDVDTGAKASLQYVLAIQRTDKGDSIIEGDSDNAQDVQNPRTNLRLSNFTFLANATSGNGAAIMMRGGMDATLANGVVYSPNQPCLQFRNTKTVAAADASDDNMGPPAFHSVVMQCGTNAFASHSTVDASTTESIFNAGTEVNAKFTASLSSLFVNGANETAVKPYDATLMGAFFDKTTYVGAVKDASDTWYRGWSCDSATASFGSDSACTTLPTA